MDAYAAGSNALLSAARQAFFEGDLLRALDELAQAWPRIEALTGPAGDEARADAHELRGRVYLDQQALDQAAAEFEALQACTAREERRLEARARLSGIAAARGGDEEAGAQLREIAQEAMAIRHDPALAIADYEQGRIAYRRGETEQALKYLRSAWVLTRALRDPRAQYAALVALGNVHARRGEYDGAIRMHEEALRLAVEVGDRLSAAEQLNHVGEWYQRLGDMFTALDYHHRSAALRAAHQLPASPDVIRNLGVDLLGLGQDRRGEALEYLRRALEASRRERSKDTTLRALASLADALLQCDELVEAEATARELLDEANAVPAPFFAAQALLVLGRIGLARGDRAGAYSLLEEGYCAAQGAGSHELRWQLHAAMAEAATAPALAEVHERIAAEMLLESAAVIKDEELKRRFLDMPRARKVVQRGRARGITVPTRRLVRL